MNAYGRVLSWGARAWRTPASRSRRQVVNREEYKPSRRSSAPTPPEPLAWPASARMRCLYSAVKRRRLRIHEMHEPGTPSTTTGAIRDRDMRDPQMAECWRAAGDLGLMIQMHFIPHYAPQIGELAAKFRNTPVLLDHRSEEHTSELQSPCNLVCR